MKTNSALERAAMRLWRVRNTSTVAEAFWRFDATCTCALCAARRAFAKACRDHAEGKGRAG